MPSAPKIRKEILHILESSILPALRQGEILQVLAAPPFDFSQVQPHRLREEFLPDNDEGPLQVLRSWPEEGLVANRNINFSFCYAGEMHRKIGITQKSGEEMALQGLPRPAGITMIKVPSPSVVVTGPFIARETNADQPGLDQDISKTCSVVLSRDEVSLFHSSHSPHHHTGSHLLSIQDFVLNQLLKLYYEALCRGTDTASTQAILLAAFQRLHHQLSHTRPQISNSCWLDPATELQLKLTNTESKHQALCREVIDYVHNHLHTSLSIDMLARHFNVSAYHLNRVFRSVQNTTVMHYVTELRIKVAKRLLAANREQIKEVAQLVGFASVTSFCTVFRRHTGLTPSQYRKLHKK